MLGKVGLYRHLGFSLVMAFFVLVPWALNAQGTSVIRGRIIDSDTAEPVFGANVIIRAQSAFTQTDFDGKYQLSVPAGTHTVEIQMIGFDKVVRQVTVDDGATRDLNITLGIQQLDVVVVKGRSLTNTEASMLALQKKAGSVSDGITAESIKKSPDSSAGDVLKRVTGITLVGGKYVFVRGLGERYSNTELNGLLVASPEPDKRVVPMDMFPAGLIKNIRVMKTFTPEDPAEFSGGLVKVETKEYPDNFELNVGAGLGYNTNSTGQTMKLRQGGGNENLGLYNDFFGFGTDYRSRPLMVRSLPEFVKVQYDTDTGLDRQTMALIHSQFNQSWSAKRFTAQPDRKFSFSVGDSTNIFESGKIGYVFGSAYKQGWEITDIKENRWNTVSTVEPNLFFNRQYRLELKNSHDIREYKEEVMWGNNLNLTLEPINGQKISSKTFYSVQSENYFMDDELYKSENEFAMRAETSGFKSREMVHQVISGTHALQFGNLTPHIFSWDVGYSEANRYEPDLKWRIWTRKSEEIEIPTINFQEKDGFRYDSETTDIGRSVNANYEIPFKQWDGLSSKIKFGGHALNREKAFIAHRYSYSKNRTEYEESDMEYYPVAGEIQYNPSRFFSEELYFKEEVTGFPAYNAFQKLHAYYAQLDMPLVPKLRLLGGARFEDSYQKTRTYNPKDSLKGDRPYYGCDDYNYIGRQAMDELSKKFPGEFCKEDNNGVGELATKDVLPSVNLTYEATKDINIRAGYSETVTRPDLRELSEYGFSPYALSDRVYGNYDLNRTYIHNYDLRFEWYINTLDYVGVGVFHKEFSEPIEIVGKGITATGITEYQYYNADNGKITGLELETRTDLADFFRLEVNAFLINSKVEIMPWYEKATILVGGIDPNSREAVFRPTNLERPMQGQSPYVVNTKAIFFIDRETDHSIGVYYNVFGDRIRRIGAEAAPDVVERGTGEWDLVYSVSPGENLVIKVSAKNITNARYRWYQVDPSIAWANDAAGFEVYDEQKLYYSYRKGVDWTASLTYRF